MQQQALWAAYPDLAEGASPMEAGWSHPQNGQSARIGVAYAHCFSRHSYSAIGIRSAWRVFHLG